MLSPAPSVPDTCRSPQRAPLLRPAAPSATSQRQPPCQPRSGHSLEGHGQRGWGIVTYYSCTEPSASPQPGPPCAPWPFPMAAGRCCMAGMQWGPAARGQGTAHTAGDQSQTPVWTPHQPPQAKPSLWPWHEPLGEGTYPRTPPKLCRGDSQGLFFSAAPSRQQLNPCSANDLPANKTFSSPRAPTPTPPQSACDGSALISEWTLMGSA